MITHNNDDHNTTAYVDDEHDDDEVDEHDDDVDEHADLCSHVALQSAREMLMTCECFEQQHQHHNLFHLVICMKEEKL